MLLRSMAIRLLATSRGALSRVHGRWLAASVAGVVVAVTVAASAQPPVRSAGLAPAVPDTQVGFERKVQLTPKQQEIEAEALLSQMRGVSSTTQHMLAQARVARDVVKTLCLNDKLSQVDVATRSATDRRASLHSAVARGDVEMANHEFTILSVLKKRVDQLSTESNQCIGEEAAFVGATNVVTTVDTTLPTGDTTTLPPLALGAISISGPPVSASTDL
jgi:hypothetical protein